MRNQQAGQAAAGPATALSTAETELLDPVRERREAVLLAPRELVPNSPQTLPGLLAGWQNGMALEAGLEVGTYLGILLVLDSRGSTASSSNLRRRGTEGPTTRGTRGIDGDEL